MGDDGFVDGQLQRIASMSERNPLWAAVWSGFSLQHVHIPAHLLSLVRFARLNQYMAVVAAAAKLVLPHFPWVFLSVLGFRSWPDQQG